MYLKHKAMSFIMAYEVVEKNPGIRPKVLKAVKPVNTYFASWKRATLPNINQGTINSQKASDMAKVSEAFYKFMVEEAKAAGVPVLKEVPKEQLSAETRKAKLIEFYAQSVKAFKSMPPGTFTDEELSDLLMFLKYYSLSFIMTYYIIEKNPVVEPKLRKAQEPMNPYLASSGKPTPLNSYSKNASDMAKVAEDYYNFVVEEAKAAGVPVLMEVPTN